MNDLLQRLLVLLATGKNKDKSCALQFLVVDIAKAVVAAMVLPQAWRLVGPSRASRF